MTGGNLQGGARLIDNLGLCRSLSCKALIPDPIAATGYGWERNLTGLFIITAEGSDCYINPTQGTEEWLYTEQGIYIPQYCSRPLCFDHTELGFYTSRGPVRLEEIELVDPKEFLP